MGNQDPDCSLSKWTVSHKNGTPTAGVPARTFHDLSHSLADYS